MGYGQQTTLDDNAVLFLDNIYLTFATMLAADLKGIENKYPISAPIEENIYKMIPARQKKLAIKTLPRNLEEAVKTMQKSALLKETLGEHTFHTFAANKQWEIKNYQNNVSREFDNRVSAYEIQKYMSFL
ncbi:MAG: glutamine synthetase [Candidatus Aminicenantes bacterium]|nr:glutamine synthetase [Candidatus Aminicenantes bacterium]